MNSILKIKHLHYTKQIENMKTIVTIVIISFSTVFCSIAQPNPGFENWHTEASYQVPDSWQTLNMMSLALPANPLSAFKATGIDKHSGNYALKLKSVFMNNNFFQNELGDTVSVTFTGKITISPSTYKYGFPYTGRPEKLEFWAKYFPVGNDTAAGGMILTKWNGVQSDTVALCGININSTGTYTLMKSDLVYYSDELPDSASIVFLSSKLPSCARVNSTLYVDDVDLTGWVGIEKHDIYADKVQLFPNPAKDEINIFAKIEEANLVKVIDATGKFIGAYKIQNYKVLVNTSLFPSGIYFYELLDKKNKSLTKGKFSVVK